MSAREDLSTPTAPASGPVTALPTAPSGIETGGDDVGVGRPDDPRARRARNLAVMVAILGLVAIIYAVSIIKTGLNAGVAP